MSKELKALKRIKKMYEYFVKENRDLEPKLMICEKEDFKIIENALKENERLKTSYLRNLLNEESKEYIYKKLVALEIIVNKEVNVGDFVRCKSVEDYNDYCCYNEKEQLTQEEFDLLQEVLL